MHPIRKMRLLLLTTVGCCLVTILGGTQLVQGDAMTTRDVIAERQDVMKNNAANFRDLRSKMKDGHVARMAVNAHNIALNTGRIPRLFPEGSMETPESPSRAKAEIWQDLAGFTAASEEAQAAALALMNLTKDAAGTGVPQEDLVTVVKALGHTCKQCHKKFRKPKQRR